MRTDPSSIIGVIVLFKSYLLFENCLSGTLGSVFTGLAILNTFIGDLEGGLVEGTY